MTASVLRERDGWCSGCFGNCDLLVGNLVASSTIPDSDVVDQTPLSAAEMVLPELRAM